MNLNKECDCKRDDANIISGGIGKSYVELSVTTGFGCGNYHKFLIFNNTKSGR